MNIFYLDRDPATAAAMHCDKHVVKMILETAQMLSTAHRVLDGDDPADEVGLYKRAFENHPCSIWLRDCVTNYMWGYNLFTSLLKEYTRRYKKFHASNRLSNLLSYEPDNIAKFKWECNMDAPMSWLGVTEPPQCMPDKYKCEDPVQAYRNYYLGEKMYMAVWTEREVPAWIQ